MYVQLYPERVKTLREEQGMSKRDLAVAAGISKTTARKVATALGVDPPQRLGRPAHRP